MKSLAALKRTMLTGTTWECTVLEGAVFPTWANTGLKTLIREVKAHQSNGVYLSLPDGRDSFLGFGKSSDWVFNDSNTVVLLNHKGIPQFQYTLKGSFYEDPSV